MVSQQHESRRGVVSLYDLLMLLLLFLSIVVGVKYGIRWGWSYGTLGAIGGGLVGFVAGVAFAILALLLAALASRSLEAFGHWWRPYPPPCENGVCTRSDQHHFERLPDETRENRPDISAYGYRCECGSLYSPLGGTRWVRVLPNKSLAPYLVHGTFGRWQRDPAKELPPYKPLSEPVFFGRLGAATLVLGAATVILARFPSLGVLRTVGTVGIMTGGTLLLLVAVDRIFGRRPRVQTVQNGHGQESDTGEIRAPSSIPGWTILLLTTFLTGGTAFFAMYLGPGLHDATARWLTASCAALGLVLGAAIWLGSSWREKRTSRGGRDPLDLVWFFGVKVVSLVPGAVAVIVWIAPPSGQTAMGNLIVSLLAGGLFLAGFCGGGLTVHEPEYGFLSQVNKVCSRLTALGVILAILGFALGLIAGP